MKARERSSRRVTPEKLRRDVENIRAYARFVIVINGGVPKVIDNRDRVTGKLPLARLIAVIGPVKRGNLFLGETVLLEIGYSRTRPYAQIEQGGARKKVNGKNGQRIHSAWHIKERLRARKISDKELRSVYPFIEQCIAGIVLECRESWNVKAPWWVDGPGAIERGIYFTFSKSDRLLYRQVLVEDVRHRKEKYISWHAKCIRRWLSHYRSSNYSDKQLRGFSGTCKVADLVSRYRKPVYREALARCFQEGSHVQTLVSRIDGAFRLNMRSRDPHTVFVFDGPETGLGLMHSVRCYAVDQPVVHARGCLVVEVILERSYREKHEIPF